MSNRIFFAVSIITLSLDPRLTLNQTTKFGHDQIESINFADNKINVAQMLGSVFDRIENIVGKGENAGYQNFLLYPQCFQKASFLKS